MKASEFCYWLQGYFELAKNGSFKTDGLNQQQVEMIERHLVLVFKHDIDQPDPTGELQQIHDGNDAMSGSTYRC